MVSSHASATEDVERNTESSQAETLAQANRLAGYPWTALKEAFYGQHASSLSDLFRLGLTSAIATPTW